MLCDPFRYSHPMYKLYRGYIPSSLSNISTLATLIYMILEP